METLYNLTLKYIHRRKDINYSFSIPKPIHRDINISMKKCNDFYFARVCNDFYLFCNLLLANCLADLHLINYLRRHPSVAAELANMYMQINEVNFNLGILLGNILKMCGFLTKSEKVLCFAFNLCKNKEIGLNILKDLLHVQTLLKKNVEADKTFKLLRERICEMENNDMNLAVIYNSCASYELSRYKHWEAYFWAEKSLNGMNQLPARDIFEICLVQIRILRVRHMDEFFYLEKAVKNYKRMKRSPNSMILFYYAKLLREYILYRGKRKKFVKFFSKLPKLKRRSERDLILSIYEKTLGNEHVMTIKIRKEALEY